MNQWICGGGTKYAIRHSLHHKSGISMSSIRPNLGRTKVQKGEVMFDSVYIQRMSRTAMLVLVIVFYFGLASGQVVVETSSHASLDLDGNASNQTSFNQSLAPIACPTSANDQFIPAEPDHIHLVQANPCPNGHTCITYACGASGAYCCPAGHPYLSHCDCQCYVRTPDCQSYSACR